jgi:hypothetical protein
MIVYLSSKMLCIYVYTHLDNTIIVNIAIVVMIVIILTQQEKKDYFLLV